jgi:hypothetical protein
MAADCVPGQMRSAASALLGVLDDRQRMLVARPFTDDAARRWLEYRPRPRPGGCVAEISGAARKAAHRLLATALSDHAYAQAMAMDALGPITGCKATTC